MTDPKTPPPYSSASYTPAADSTQPVGGSPHSAAAGAQKTLSIVSLALGLASIFLGISILVPIAGIVVGVMARKREPAGRTMALWGIWLSVITLVVGALLWIVFGAVIIGSIGLLAGA